jgi:hypothetical protein
LSQLQAWKLRALSRPLPAQSKMQQPMQPRTHLPEPPLARLLLLVLLSLLSLLSLQVQEVPLVQQQK